MTLGEQDDAPSSIEVGGLEGFCLLFRERAKNDDVEEGNVAVSCSAGDGTDASDSQCVGLLPRWCCLGIGHPTSLTERRDEKPHTPNGNITNEQWKLTKSEAEGSNPKGIGTLFRF